MAKTHPADVCVCLCVLCMFVCVYVTTRQRTSARRMPKRVEHFVCCWHINNIFIGRLFGFTACVCVCVDVSVCACVCGLNTALI